MASYTKKLVKILHSVRVCMQDTFFSRAHLAARPSSRDVRVSCIQGLGYRVTRGRVRVARVRVNHLTV